MYLFRHVLYSYVILLIEVLLVLVHWSWVSSLSCTEYKVFGEGQGKDSDRRKVPSTIGLKIVVPKQNDKQTSIHKERERERGITVSSR